MSVELLQYLSAGSFMVAAVLFAVAVVLFILFRIPAIISDLSGLTERRAVKKLKRQHSAAEDISESEVKLLCENETDALGLEETSLLEKTIELGEIYNETNFKVLREIGFWESQEVIL